MLKLDIWPDFFKPNKELLDDDYNANQYLQAKLKQKTTDNVRKAPHYPLFQSFADIIAVGKEYHIQTRSRR